MRLEIKLRGDDRHSVAASRRMNDPTGAVVAESSETNRHVTERDETTGLLYMYSTTHICITYHYVTK